MSDTLVTRLAVTLKFRVDSFLQIEPEIKQRADTFFGDEPYDVGWIDVTIGENGVIDVEANVHLPYNERTQGASSESQ